MPLTTMRTKNVIAAAEARASALGHQVAVCVVDVNGLIMGSLKMDGARFTTNDIALGKARACAGTGVSNAEMAERASRPVFQYQLIHQGFIFAQGGEPIFENDEFVGAVGVSGAPGGPSDEVIARFAASA